MVNDAESGLIFEHGDILRENVKKCYHYTYTELYEIANKGNRFELHPYFRMHDHPDYD